MKKILIVDDKPEVRALISVTLDMGEFTLYETSSGSQALEVANDKHPDLIILDVMMPGGLDGYQTCEKLKSDEKTKDIIVILLTARGQETDKQRGGAAGADDYFIKPFSPRELLDKVYAVLKI